jgi:hypothetical protein
MFTHATTDRHREPAGRWATRKSTGTIATAMLRQWSRPSQIVLFGVGAGMVVLAVVVGYLLTR